MARKKSGKPSRRPRLFHVGQVPQSRTRAGLPAPPTIPCLNPQSFRQPTVVKLKPTIVGGNQSLKGSMDLGPFQTAAIERSPCDRVFLYCLPRYDTDRGKPSPCQP